MRAPPLVVLVVAASLAACRLGFEPLAEESAEDSPIGGTSSQTVTAQPGSDFITACTPGQPCMVDCREALSCIVQCNGASSCDVLCNEASCVVEACVAPACEVDCGAASVLTFGALATCD